MYRYMIAVLSLLFFSSTGYAKYDDEVRYVVMSLSIGEVNPDHYQSGLLFMSLYFDLQGEVDTRFPQNIAPVYAEISVITVAGNTMGEILPSDPRYGSKLITRTYREFDPEFEARLTDYNSIAPWYEVRVDTPILQGFDMKVWTYDELFHAVIPGESLPRHSSAYHARSGFYEIRGSIRTPDHGSDGFNYTIRSDEPGPEIFMFNVTLANELPFEVCEADVNADGEINFFDITAFIESYQEGCP